MINNILKQTISKIPKRDLVKSFVDYGFDEWDKYKSAKDKRNESLKKQREQEAKEKEELKANLKKILDKLES